MLRPRRTKDLFKQLESRSLTAVEEEIIQQRVRRGCLRVDACRAAYAAHASVCLSTAHAAQQAMDEEEKFS